MNSLTPYQIIFLGCGCILLGYLIFLLLLFFLPRRLKAENQQQKQLVIKKAMAQKEKIMRDSVSRSKNKISLDEDRLEGDIADRKSDLTSQEEEIQRLAETVTQAEQRIKRQERDLNSKNQKVTSAQSKYQQAQDRLEDLNRTLNSKLEELAGEQADIVQNKLKNDLIEARKIDTQKSLKNLQEGLESHINRIASRVHSRIASRYEPSFVWPKSSSVIEVTSKSVLDTLNDSNNTLLAELRELTEDVQIDFATDKNENPVGIKLVGGYGIYKEAAKITLEEVLRKSPNNWQKARSIYQKHRSNLEAEAFKLGKSAVLQLSLTGIHDEILKMIGALNWRTSYRQNQFLHSLEVAKLAGIIAHELKVDPDVAKRCGILHDIGKGIDYRIEGSHAVISGDYADRFGESRLVCDTVMSHHNDLVLETPMSYVLKSADTLSGARPGARVNLEEGYQIRLSAIDQAVRSFPGITKVAIMSGGREVHVDVNHKQVSEKDIQGLTEAIARKIEETVAYPGQIKVLLSRRFEASAVA